jgi:hypothetical protein
LPPLSTHTVGPSGAGRHHALRERRERHRAARLGHELRPVEEPAHGAGERAVVDGDHVVEVRPVVGPRHVPDAHAEQAVGQPLGVGHRDRRAGRARARQLGRARRLDAHDARVRRQQLHRRRHPRAQPAAPHRHEHEPHVGAVLGDLEPDGPLPRHDVRVVERRHEHRAGVGDDRVGPRGALGARAAGELDARAQPLGAAALGVGGVDGHHHRGRHAEQPRGQRHRLRVVPRRRRDHARARAAGRGARGTCRRRAA